jgi:hypothetical protein
MAGGAVGVVLESFLADIVKTQERDKFVSVVEMCRSYHVSP